MMTARNKKSKSAYVLLTLFGFALVFVAVSSITSGCFLAFHGNFQDPVALEDKISTEFDYSHFWLGGSYLVTAGLTLYSGCRQTKRRLTFTTTAFLLISVALSMFAIVLDGPDWVEWKNIDRRVRRWEGKEGYNCRSLNNTCTCSKDNDLDPHIASAVSDCDQALTLATIYGIVVSGAIVGLVVCLAALFFMVNSVSWKNPWKAYTSYTASYVNKGAFSSLDDVLQMYKEHRQPATNGSSSTSSLPRPNKEYMPAWSLYGSTTEEMNNPEP